MANQIKEMKQDRIFKFKMPQGDVISIARSVINFKQWSDRGKRVYSQVQFHHINRLQYVQCI